ncbi:MAG: phosphotransferase [Bacteroidales bacterium]|nr:phosphotransferase [Bacteroidales bacterium]
MIEINGQTLEGGLMNAPTLLDNKVYRQITKSTETIHQLLKHARSKGINWIPEPISFDLNTEVLSYIKGEVPHEMPSWIWNQSVLTQVALRMREWHDATVDFECDNPKWSFDTNTEHQVICHNDFAPYNCVFVHGDFVGLFDFDLCSPGSRLWDMSYTAYRYIPIMPTVAIEEESEVSPFDIEEMNIRINMFLKAYSKDDLLFMYTRKELLNMIIKRLIAISDWTRKYAEETKNEILIKNALMYKRHSNWVESII